MAQTWYLYFKCRSAVTVRYFQCQNISDPFKTITLYLIYIFSYGHCSEKQIISLQYFLFVFAEKALTPANQIVQFNIFKVHLIG